MRRFERWGRVDAVGVETLVAEGGPFLSGMFMDQQGPDRFSPHLDALDRVVQAIQIKKKAPK